MTEHLCRSHLERPKHSYRGVRTCLVTKIHFLSQPFSHFSQKPKLKLRYIMSQNVHIMNGETVTETERAFRHLIDLFYWPICTFCYKHAHCCYHTSPQYSAYFAYLNTKWTIDCWQLHFKTHFTVIAVRELSQHVVIPNCCLRFGRVHVNLCICAPGSREYGLGMRYRHIWCAHCTYLTWFRQKIITANQTKCGMTSEPLTGKCSATTQCAKIIYVLDIKVFLLFPHI